MAKRSLAGSAADIRPADRRVQTAVAIFEMLFRERLCDEFALAFWDGSVLPAKRPERFRLRIRTPGTLRLALRAPIDLHAGRAFAAGLLECDGDVEAAVDLLYESVSRFRNWDLPKLLRLLHQLPKETLPPLREARLRGRVHSSRRDRAAIGFHYDQPLAFYRAFLDPDLVYSCAYYDRGIETLEDAQRSKLDYVLRKLRLAPGERLLDIGCGWGALVVRAAQHFGAQVLGVTLSAQQHAEAEHRIRAAGLGDRARVELRDYRELEAESFDKIASVGMVEHVGRTHLPEYFSKAFALLKPGGLFLNHGISEQGPGRRGGKVTGFMERFVFPDGELVAVSDALQIAERIGFEVRDVENLREHYARTLRAWVRNLESHAGDAIASAGEQAYRTWRLYLAGSAQGFRTGRMGIFQSLLAKPDAGGLVALPATRRDLYDRS